MILLTSLIDVHIYIEKTELFLELYGNTLIRSHTVQYIRETANILIK